MQVRREIDQRAGRARDGDAVPARDVGGCEVAAVDRYARPARLAGGGHGYRELRPRAEAPQLGGGAVAEHGPRTAGEHSGHQLAFARQRPAPHRIGTAVNGMQPPHGHPVLDRIGMDAEREQLLTSDHPML